MTAKRSKKPAPEATAHDFVLPIKDEKTLKDYIQLAYGVSIPDKQVCPDHSTPWRAFCDSYFAYHPVSVWKASRGFGGKSFTLAMLGKVMAETLKADVNILGGSGEQARRVLEHIQRFANSENAPRDLFESGVQREMRLVWGNTINALMASQASVRGPHPQKLLCDECDEMKLDILDAALGQTMSVEGIPAQTTLSSTHQYADGTMTDILRRAAKNGWVVHTWCWRETQEPHGWLSQEEIARKRNEIPEGMWRTEYDLQEPAAESRAIQPNAVEQMFDKSLGEFEGNPHEYIEIEPPDPKGVYATGADWARAHDWTVITTYRVDVNPAKCVAWERTGRLDWPVMVARYEDRLTRYKGNSSHDATGIGDVIQGYLREPSRGMQMVGRDRAELLTRYIAACEHGEIVYPFIRFAYNEHKYASVEDVYSSGPSYHLPDSISAGALGWSVHRQAGVVQSIRIQQSPMARAFGNRR